MHENGNTRPAPEYSWGSTNEILAQYEQFATTAVSAHQAALHSVRSRHMREFARPIPDVQHADNIFRRTQEGLQAAMSETATHVTYVVGGAAQRLNGLLTPQDQQVLAVTRELIYSDTVPNVDVRAQNVQNALNAHNHMPLRIALDIDILNNLRIKLATRNFAITTADTQKDREDQREINWLLAMASSDTSRRAMAAALDEKLLQTLGLRLSLDTEGHTYTIFSKQLDTLLGRFSSDYAARAARCFLDGDILQRLRAGSVSPHSVLRYAGCLGTQRYLSGVAPEHHFDGGFARGEYIRESHDQERQQPTSSHTTEGKPVKKDPVGEKVAKAIEAAILKSSRNKWMERDPDGMRRVVSTVLRLRQKNPGITDPEIYRRYHDKLNRDREFNSTDSLRTSFTILHTLMGGPRGKLPF